jgi:ATP-dependent helicase HrpA
MSTSNVGERRTIRYPPELPVSQRKDDIAAAIRDHQVVIVAGETGSGKTTQLPKICLELGRGRDGAIGHTQPRRVAARTVAERIASELETELGDLVGYKVRFTDRSSEATAVKVMTDGVLLAEMQRDRELRAYDTIIIDEAHERSLNIDFLLGYLKQLLPRRPDLKVVITSATIDPERFSAHFDEAPIIEVSGRTYPVEVRYRELADDQTQGIVDAVVELVGEGPGDILVFLSGEREIKDAAEALRRLHGRLRREDFEVLPLYARLSAAEQHRVFAPHGMRRIVLATNVAETSLTVPGVRYVVDTGLARISRFSARTKVQRLPIEPISRASANQRKGRCGREAPGICIRLYAEVDFEARPEFTEPEILRTNLASVILQMASLNLGDIARFPFVEPPDTRSVQAGIQLLEEVGAIRPVGRRGPRSGRLSLTTVGRQLARLPVDPRLARMLVEADRLGCLRETITVVAALSIQDPRERPADQQELADQSHRRFADPSSDFAAILNLWSYVREQQRELSSSKFRRMCRREFLNYLRIREWQDLDSQLRRVAKELGFTLNRTAAAAEPIHRALLAGLLSHIGQRDPERRDYLGARGGRFAIFPGSSLFKKPPEFVMAAELVETGRLWARTNAAIDPAWAEEAGEHLIKRTYSEAHWEKRRAGVVAFEKVTLYGVPIVADRKVDYGHIDPAAAREIFIRSALVERDWDSRHRFLARNAELLDEAEGLESRARRRGIVVDDETLFDFYAERIPDDVVSGAHFDAWWKRERSSTPDLLTFSLDMLVSNSADAVSAEDYPEVWRYEGADLPLSYEFDPGSRTDGVTVEVPVAALGQLSDDDFSWPVPGLRFDLVVALIRSLPKAVRVNFVPAPNFTRMFLDSVTPGEEPLLDALSRYLRKVGGVVVEQSDWDLDKVPAHLRTTFRVRGDDGQTLAEGKDLAHIRDELIDSTAAAVSAAASAIERTGITTWDFGPLPREYEQTRAGHVVRGFPALVDDGDAVAVRVLAAESSQAPTMRRGVRRLLALASQSPASEALAAMTNEERLTLALAPHGSPAALVADAWDAAIDAIVAASGLPWDESAFALLRDRVAADGEAILRELLGLTREALVDAYAVDRRLSGRAELALLPALADMKAQWARLVFPGFVAEAGREQLRRYPRYLAAIGRRLDQLAADPRRDAGLMGTIAPLQAAYLDRVAALPSSQPPTAELVQVRWLLEELRISLWAQDLKTAVPVSPQRVARALAEA